MARPKNGRPFSRAVFLPLVLFAHTLCHAEPNVRQRGEDWRVTELVGKAFLKDRPDRSEPSPLKVSSPIPYPQPVLLVSAKDSFLEISNSDGEFLRLGRSTVAEFSKAKVRLRQGSLLKYSEREKLFALSGKDADAGIRLRKRVLMAETTGNGGLKIILLSGYGQAGTQADGAKTLKSGQLLFVHGKPTRFGDLFDLDLPLLLKTSRLVNAFARPLPNLARTRTSALIQELNMKGRFEALVGDAPDNKNIQMWTVRRKEKGRTSGKGGKPQP